MADTPSKIHYPTGADFFQPHVDMEALARSVSHIVPVANTTERNAVADAFQPSLMRPLYVNRADTGALECNDGNGWQYLVRSYRLTGSAVFTPGSFGPLLNATADVIQGADGQPQTVILNVRIGGPHEPVNTGGQSTPVGTVAAPIRPADLQPVSISAGSNGAQATLSSGGDLNIRWTSAFLPNQLNLSFLASYPIR